MISGEVPNEYGEKIEGLVDAYQSVSGMRFLYSADINNIYCHWQSDVQPSEEEALDYLARQGIVDIPTPDRQMLLESAKTAVQKEHIGGVGTTSRTLSELSVLMPNAIQPLLTVPSGEKIVFLGNGLSPACVEIIEVRRGARLGDPKIVINDVFDYHLVQQDLHGLQRLFEVNRIPKIPSLHDFITCVNKIVTAIDKKEISAVTYRIGSGRVPEALQNARIVVNAVGPLRSSLADQLSCLKPGGRLLTTDVSIAQVPEGFKLEVNGLTGSEITRIY